jgi:uncharacterized protein YgbK (DUF1537 family)
LYLGVVADDLTGASDIALMLARAGFRTVQHVGVPQDAAELPDADAIVVSLKTRTAPADEAILQSLNSMRRLREAGAQRIYFKYCSTFDSTAFGNIGPVAEELAAGLSAPVVPFCPALPANGRTVYRGHLFVGDLLLSDSPMKDHPLTPMRDANLVRVLQAQTRERVGLIALPVVTQGPDAIRAAFKEARLAGTRFVVVDALDDGHLATIAAACGDLPLVTGGSGLALGMTPPRENEAGDTAFATTRWAATRGSRLILAGSCSAATRDQVGAALDAGIPAFQLIPLKQVSPADAARRVLEWLTPRLGLQPVLVYSSVPPDELTVVQETFGPAAAGEWVEACLAAVARGAVVRGVRQMIIAGGETSGAVIAALGVRNLDVGPEIEPGVPWLVGRDEPLIALALKSGNFGGSDFFLSAWRRLDAVAGAKDGSALSFKPRPPGPGETG